MDRSEKISQLRNKMKEHGIDAYIIQDNDPHNSEYVADHWKARSWLSGFTGSVGTFIVTMKDNGLWVDGRYHIQAEEQLKGSDIKLFKEGTTEVPTYIEWLSSILETGGCVGFDGRVFSQGNTKKLHETIAKKCITIDHEHDLVGQIWNDRPLLVFNKIIHHDIKFTGKSSREKIKLVRDIMKRKNVDYYILGSLDDIGWLFNIRGADIPHNPVAIAYGIVTQYKAELFVNYNQLDQLALHKLLENNVDIYDYKEIIDMVSKIEQNHAIYIDTSSINKCLYDAISSKCKIVEGRNITTDLKAIKNMTEEKNLVNCQIRDGVAMVEFIYWLEKNIDKETITETTVSNKLEQLRRQKENFVGSSFNSIIAYKDHAAMMHYQASKDSEYTLRKKGLLLVDSGGQYLDGTTDITRTISLGEITEKEKIDFTLVLKGHIALCNAKFLYGATGSNLDILARYPLWQKGIDYKCGTGHGIGYFLNVHEGPQSFSQIPNTSKLEKGMIITVEPGIYKEGAYGIRIENTVIVSEDEITEFGQFMRFEVISYCPIDIKAISIDMLTGYEINWINEYHRKVYINLHKYLDDDTKEWLKENTRPIKAGGCFEQSPNI